MPEPDAREPAVWELKLAERLALIRQRLTGHAERNPLGFDAEFSDEVLLALFRPLYRSWFRVEALGLENVPESGGALLVSNHSGTLPLDALMTTLALLDHHPAHRHLRLLAADLVFSTPVLGQLAQLIGATLASPENADRLLRAGEVVGVYPEGFKGIGKPFRDRYRLQRFGRGGFVSTALRTGVPIIPVSVVGAEETYPMIGNADSLARTLGLPYLPITPTFPLLGPLGLVPLPTKWWIEFGEAVSTAGYGSDDAQDPLLVLELADQIRETIQHSLARLIARRRSVFY